MAVNFPDNPSNGDSFTSNGIVYVYNSTTTAWQKSYTSVPPVVTGHVLPDANETYDLGSTTQRFRDLYLSGNTLYIGGQAISINNEGVLQLPSGSLIDGQVIPSEIGEMTNVRLEPNPEVLEMAVDAPTAGHSAPWVWSWKSGALPYARTTISNQSQSDVPIYIDGTYTLFNFAAHELHGAMTQTHKIYLKWIEGAGLDNLVSWATSTLNVQNITFEGVNGDNATEVQRLNISVPSTITLPTLVAPNLAYDVSFANAGAYTFSGIAMGDNPDIGPLYRGGTYTFNLDASLSGHPFYLTQDDGTNWSQGQYIDEYTNGVTGSRNESGTLVFTVPNDAPDILYYQCGNHSSMRGMLTIKNLEVETNGSGNYIVYFQHDQEEHVVPVEIRQRPSIAGQSCLVYDSSLSEFVPQDMGDYITKTPVIQERIGELAEDKIVEKVNDDTVTNLTKVKEQTTFVTNLNQQGELQLVTGTARWYAPFNLLVTGITAKVSSSADADISIEIKKNGTVVKSDSILAGQFSSVVSAPEFSMAEGDYITVDVTSIGTTNKGEDLVVQFKYRQT